MESTVNEREPNPALGKCDALAAVCQALTGGAHERAVDILRDHYPFAPEPMVRRRYGPVQATRVFVRDGFIDRYTGERLIFPPVFRVISVRLPAQFPFHPNWKTDVTHPAYWEMGATIDHLVPVSRGGADDEANWVTTSMARNSAKCNWMLEELGWTLHPRGDGAWDGLMRWYLDYTAAHPEVLLDGSMRQWRKGAELALKIEAPTQ